MLIRLISLVFLFVFLKITSAFSEDNINFIYPKEKPSIFKKIDTAKQNISKIPIPIKKPGNSIENKKLKKVEKSTVNKEPKKKIETI